MLDPTILLALWLAQGPASGPQTASATLSLNIGSHARVAFASTTLTFPDADPDLVPLVTAMPQSVEITAKARTPRNAQVSLTLQAADDLRSGVTTLPAALIRWTATGTGFAPGTLSRTSAQIVATWTGSGVRSGSQSFAFENKWTHPPGTYSVTLVYTMSTP
jgi:hypothetical protein